MIGILNVSPIAMLVYFFVSFPSGYYLFPVAYTVNDEKTLKRGISSLKNISDSLPKYLLTLDYAHPILVVFNE